MAFPVDGSCPETQKAVLGCRLDLRTISTRMILVSFVSVRTKNVYKQNQIPQNNTWWTIL